MLISVLVALVAFIAIFWLLMLVLPKFMGAAEGEHTKHALKQIMEETQNIQRESATDTIFRSDLTESAVLHSVSMMPGGQSLANHIIKAGFGGKAAQFMLFMLLLLFILLMLATNAQMGIIGYILSVLAAYFVPFKYLERRIQKRNDAFINMFPDVLDMIVRSVRSGFPLNTAIQMVAENMEPPVSTEFKQVADEIALGRTLDEALSRLAERIDEPDIAFFVVVLNVQQETGGNLAEVIGNLSAIIRKRKQLRMKIKAMTSEGRATGWVLGGLPVVVFSIIHFLSPTHLEPLFTTSAGNMLLMAAVGLIGVTFWVIKQMVNIDI